MIRRPPLSFLSPLFLLMFLNPLYADVYTRQPGIDIVHYEINIELTDASDLLTCVTRVHVRIRADSISEMWLDLEDMTVDTLQVGGVSLPFTHHEKRLSFALDRSYRRGEIAIIEVHYHGQPRNRGMLVGKNKYGRRVFFAENWPNRAHHWFPSVDHPSDKATVEFSVTAPVKYDIVANGSLLETRSLLDGRKLTRWEERIPIPVYCMVIGAAEFTIANRGIVDSFPLSDYSYPQDAGAAAHKFARSKLVLEYFIDLIGPYPYEKLAQVESTTRIGGMENSSAIFYTERSFQSIPVRERPVPHEIAHQWFGDSITPADWDHLWLSEGFATYFNALFYEFLEGPEALKERMVQAAVAVKKYHKVHPTAIIDPELTDLMKKLNAFNYQKGAWVLHMLRGMLGDELFFKGIRRYYRLYAGKNVWTEDFQRVMESVSGRSLDKFFHQWLYQPGWPAYRVSWRWNEVASEVEIMIQQVQTTGLFVMPMEIFLQSPQQQKRETILVEGEKQTIHIPSAFRPHSVSLDPDNWVLKSVTLSGVGKKLDLRKPSGK